MNRRRDLDVATAASMVLLALAVAGALVGVRGGWTTQMSRSS